MTNQQSPRSDRLAMYLIRVATYLIRLASSRLPGQDREDRYREWTAELHAIAHDPGIPSRERRAVRALLYAVDQHRGVRRLRQTAVTPVPRLPLRARARNLRKRPGPVAQGLILTAVMLNNLTITWINSHNVLAFAVTAVLTVAVYALAASRLMRRANPHFLENPEDKGD